MKKDNEMYTSYLIYLVAFLYTMQFKVSEYKITKQNIIYVALFLTNRKAACSNLKLSIITILKVLVTPISNEHLVFTKDFFSRSSSMGKEYVHLTRNISNGKHRYIHIHMHLTCTPYTSSVDMCICACWVVLLSNILSCVCVISAGASRSGGV